MKRIPTKAVLLQLLRTSSLYTKQRRHSGHRASDTSSMGDVAFLLLIFFIVTTSFILRQGIFFTLPSKSEGAQTIEKERLVTVSPTQTGYTCDEKELTAAAFRTVLEEKLDAEQELVVLIRMPEELAYERLIKTLSLVKESGVKTVSVKKVTEERS